MTDAEKLQEYGDIYTKIQWEGGTGGIFDWGNPVDAELDSELSNEFDTAANAVAKFDELLKARIEELGGNTEDYEA